MLLHYGTLKLDFKKTPKSHKWTEHSFRVAVFWLKGVQGFPEKRGELERRKERGRGGWCLCLAIRVFWLWKDIWFRIMCLGHGIWEYRAALNNTSCCRMNFSPQILVSLSTAWPSNYKYPSLQTVRGGGDNSACFRLVFCRASPGLWLEKEVSQVQVILLILDLMQCTIKLETYELIKITRQRLSKEWPQTCALTSSHVQYWRLTRRNWTSSNTTQSWQRWHAYVSTTQHHTRSLSWWNRDGEINIRINPAIKGRGY